MVCRTTQIGSAVTSYARLASGLEDQQCLSTYHELLREGRDGAAPSADERGSVISALQRQVENDPNLTDARRRSIVSRLERARTQEMTGQQYYAVSRLVARSQRARVALDDYYDQVGRETGQSRTAVAASVARYSAEAEENRRLRADRDWQQGFAGRPEHANLPLDRQTAYAIQRVEQDRTSARTASPTRPAVTREPVNSRAIRSMGYDPETGRVEVELHSNPGVGYAYRMSQADYDEFRNAPSMGAHYSRVVRRTPEFRYDTEEERAAGGVHTQCPTCGQWAGQGHSCPVRDSQEERNATERVARQRARSRATDTPAATPAQAEPQAVPAQREPRRLGYMPQRRYHGDTGSFRMPSLTTVQAEARRGGAVNVDVHASIYRVANADGTSTSTSGSVTGRVVVTYQGRGQGYAVSAVTEPGDSGRDQLRCTCADYRRNYDCPHVRQAVADVQARINQDSLRQPHRLTAATESVAADLARERADSIAAQETAVATWGEPEVLYADDHAAFQAAYRAAKERVANGEHAVPYMRENATDGLGARGTGRGFGIELEFDGGDLQAIGRELHAAGLTRTARQMPYHSSRSRGYTEEHQGGWSYEQDCTVSGEIVSPVMYDTPETWENIEKVCEIVRRNGGNVSVRAGSHIHVSAGDYDHTVDNHNRLLALYRENEDLVYRLSTNPERGTHRGTGYCYPNRVPASGYRSVSDASINNQGHGPAVNLASVNGRSGDHVEFRTFDSSLDPAVIQTQIKMSLAMTSAAFRDRDHAPTESSPLGSHRAHNRQEHGASRRLTGDAWQRDTEGFRKFADRMFRRAADKEQMTGLFAVTKWQNNRGSRW